MLLFDRGNQIEYRNVNSLEKTAIRATTSMDVHSTLAMCPVNHLTLLVGSLGTFFSLDHRYKPPKRTFSPIYHQYGMQNICCMKDGSEILVFIAGDRDGVFAYCLKSGALMWHAKDVPGRDNTDDLYATDVATDGRSKIFVCDDGNGCVHVFSPDGAYAGDLIRRGERGLGSPFNISWSDKNKSLLVAHKKDGLVHVSSLKVAM